MPDLPDLRGRLPQTALDLLDCKDGRYSEWATACAVAMYAMNAGYTEDEYVALVSESDFAYDFATENGRDRSSRLESRLRKVWERTEEGWNPPLGSVAEVRHKVAMLSERLAAYRWAGRTGNTDRAVALALVAWAHEVGAWTLDASVRETALRAGVHRNTANTAMNRLHTLGVLCRDANTREGTHAQRWVLNLEWGITDQMRTHDSSLGGKGICVPITTVIDHPAFLRGALGQTAKRVWLDLMDHPGSTAAEVAARLAIPSQDTARRALVKLTDAGLAMESGHKVTGRRPATTYAVNPEGSLGRVADEYGVADWHDRTAERYERERLGYREAMRQRGAASDGAQDDPFAAGAEPLTLSVPVWEREPAPDWGVPDLTTTGSFALSHN